MTKENSVIIDNAAVTSGAMTRRQMVQRLLAGVGAGATWPMVATSHPIYALLRNDSLLDRAEELGQTSWKPVFLRSQQNGILTALAESIVPGSTRAHVSRFIDLLLSVDKPENQGKFLESLLALNAESQKRFKQDFPALDEKQKNVLLSDASTRPESPDGPKTDAEKKQSALYGHFENLKGWISGAYYSSELGMRELGWKGDYAFEAFPACARPESHH